MKAVLKIENLSSHTAVYDDELEQNIEKKVTEHEEKVEKSVENYEKEKSFGENGSEKRLEKEILENKSIFKKVDSEKAQNEDVQIEQTEQENIQESAPLLATCVSTAVNDKPAKRSSPSTSTINSNSASSSSDAQNYSTRSKITTQNHVIENKNKNQECNAAINTFDPVILRHKKIIIKSGTNRTSLNFVGTSFTNNPEPPPLELTNQAGQPQNNSQNHSLDVKNHKNHSVNSVDSAENSLKFPENTSTPSENSQLLAKNENKPYSGREVGGREDRNLENKENQENRENKNQAHEKSSTADKLYSDTMSSHAVVTQPKVLSDTAISEDNRKNTNNSSNQLNQDHKSGNFSKIDSVSESGGEVAEEEEERRSYSSQATRSRCCWPLSLMGKTNTKNATSKNSYNNAQNQHASSSTKNNTQQHSRTVHKQEIATKNSAQGKNTTVSSTIWFRFRGLVIF